MLVTFHKPDSGTRYRATYRSVDGLLVELDGGGYNKVGAPEGSVPHDLAHLLVERELGLDQGLWAVLERGGMFDHCVVLEGRRKPHADRRAREIIRAAGTGLAHAELLVRAVSDAALERRLRDVSTFVHLLGDLGPPPGLDADRLERAGRRLQDGAARWAATRRGGTLEEEWNLRGSGPRRR
ncbi:hypothetical protein [Paraconexibacter algicola]|uniref:Uncharacterized protein n=1 Tax=Paraconexibacter algicola TaxID=2133960 RepID=A0A2T4UF77_9ACTN|nr:hypothetical protein [Paraconexibacter algicola]PTL56431.1 hypothetical protein C7Y72_15835 [Paraconexibacter algicola]